MKKFLYLIIFLFPSYSCWKKCDSYTYRPLTGKIESFFGVYKPGNWWIYKNKAGTKTDSLYLVSYSDTTMRNRTACEESQQRKFTLKNTYLANAENIEVLYESVGTGINLRMFAMYASFPSFSYLITDDSIRVSSYPFNPNSHVDSITINGQKYYDILAGFSSSNLYYFGKNRGIVGWATHLDTFNLTSFRIL